ncbi:secreted protein [Actinoplanes sp. SE50]|uniref:LysM peptidoglycan-binding domain-containing protein n=1 Tax=unclassified Actinoplanes TaxID=2626549 RepID=UPI00023ECDE1|nr:secreted protein [Actinoplanes sp. SE50/110]ATO79981.1 secreted protein [Actinoplanes sp. SE50]SLL97384.1 transglycosylase [Actinoplanes sp. SE50/110]
MLHLNQRVRRVLSRRAQSPRALNRLAQAPATAGLVTESTAGPGRHRRTEVRRARIHLIALPNARPGFKRALGIAIAGLAGTVGLLATGASPASAAAADVNWDAVAKCESSGNWGINTGNGYYGGLQFSRSTWRAHGGTRYGSTANLASKSEQILIAERVLRHQGIGAWPTCGRRGLTRAHRTTSVSPYRLASYTTPLRASHTYVVRRGDTLSRIASRYHVRGGWRALYRTNAKRLSSPNRLSVGQRLAI